MTGGGRAAAPRSGPPPEAVPPTELSGVGPVRAARLARLGVASVRDLLLLVPRRLERVGPLVPVRVARESVGRPVTVEARVRGVSFLRRGRRRSLVRVTLEEDGERIGALFFNQPWMRERFARGQTVRLQGRVVATRSGPALAAPRVGAPAERADSGGEGRPLPPPGAWIAHYPLTEGLSQTLLRALRAEALERFGAALEEPLSAEELERLDLLPLPDAVRVLHRPESTREFERARRRVALEPVLELQARLAERRRRVAAGRARSIRLGADGRRALLAFLPFEPTGGQHAATLDVLADLERSTPMRRLLQGDVGTGKTAVGVLACLAVAGAGGQAAFLAPTELLAEQHWHGLRGLLRRAGVESVLLTASLGAPERRDVLRRVAAGEAEVVFGTHALFSDDVVYAGRGLDLAVIDEQQRFGVAQRARLLEKGRDTHLLLMTATPIPRTLALSIYGDLEVSFLRETPPGRGRRTTRVVRRGERLLSFLRERLAAGERAFWVCPRIEDPDDGSDVAAAEAVHARLAQGPLAEHGVELVHGRLPGDERVAALERFRTGRSGLLVGTTVIEVGVDVPEATVMVIDGAERFGLAQLHQLRGRVGRGPAPSWCLIRGAPAAADRLAVLAATEDGFAIAEEDLRRRGMGDLAGLRQAGESGEGLRGIGDDLDLLLFARRIAGERPEVLARYRERGADAG